MVIILYFLSFFFLSFFLFIMYHKEHVFLSVALFLEGGYTRDWLSSRLLYMGLFELVNICNSKPTNRAVWFPTFMICFRFVLEWISSNGHFFQLHFKWSNFVKEAHFLGNDFGIGSFYFWLFLQKPPLRKTCCTATLSNSEI